MGIAGGVVYAYLGMKFFGHSPQTARCPSHNRVGAYRASEAVGVPVCGGCRLLPVPPLGGGLWCQGGLPVRPLLWVAVNTAVSAHLCKRILASVNAGICGPCVHLQDISIFSPPVGRSSKSDMTLDSCSTGMHDHPHVAEQD